MGKRRLSVMPSDMTSMSQSQSQTQTQSQSPAPNPNIFENMSKRETHVTKKSVASKEKKGRFFGKLHDADIDTGDRLQADGNLDGLLHQFAFSNSASPAPNGSTQDSEEKDVEYDEENKPLKRQRKRRRSAMDEDECTDVPLKDLKNTT